MARSEAKDGCDVDQFGDAALHRRAMDSTGDLNRPDKYFPDLIAGISTYWYETAEAISVVAIVTSKTPTLPTAMTGRQATASIAQR